tara:strand:- start:764 stop:1015 length:252 start_codon:yes stop_codon:yes gene_type:complete
MISKNYWKFSKPLLFRVNTVVVIEHNLDVIKTADWIIDMGPEGGVNGGQIIAEGSPEKVTEINGSYTGDFLKNIINSKFKKIA